MEPDTMNGLTSSSPTSFCSTNSSSSSYSEMTTITTVTSSSNSSSSQITVKESVSETGQGDVEREKTEKSCGITITHEELTRSLDHSSPIDNKANSIPCSDGEDVAVVDQEEEDDVIYQSPNTPPDYEEEPSIDLEPDCIDPGSTDGGGEEHHSTEINASDDSDVQRPTTPTPPIAVADEPTTLTAPAHETDSSSCSTETDQGSSAIQASVSSGSGSSREIEQESIKQTLHEIISEIDREMEADFISEEVEEVADEEESLLINSAQAAQHKRSPPPVAPKKARPFSVPADFSLQHQEGNAQGPISPETGRPIDLQKIFTPASDFSGELTPRRQRRMYTSSSFYSPLHPSMEEQVELARQISHSLSADTNTNSKGQSMYVKRRNRSSKWIHEVAAAGDATSASGGDGAAANSVDDEARMTFKIPNIGPQEIQFRAKSPLKLLMNPKGQVLDLHAMRRSGMHIETQSLSPEICSSLVKDLHTPKGKGAALFAKRKQKSEKWIVDENTVKQKVISHSTAAAAAATAPTMNNQPKVDPANSRAEQQNKINSVQDRFGGPRVKLVKSPWEAALEDGTVSTAFQDMWTSSSSTTTTTTSSTTLEESKTSLTRELFSSSSSSMTASSTVLSAMPVVQPKLNMKPLDTVPKMLPNFKAQPAPATSVTSVVAADDPPLVEEKPFVLAPLRPESVDIYKLKAPKGWAFTGPVSGDSLEPRTNPVMLTPLLEPVQPKELSSSISNSKEEKEEEENVPVAAVQQQPEEEEESERERNKPSQDQPAKEDKKPTPSNGFEFELPVLRSVSASQMPPILQAEPEPLLVLPTLRPVQVNPPTSVVDNEPKLILPTLRPVQIAPPVVPAETEQPQLVLPTLRPVSEIDIAAAAPSTSAAVEWQIPPLDSRPNLQALLEREQKPVEEVAVVASTAAALKLQPIIQPKLRPQPPIPTPKPAPPAVMTEELKLAQDAQLAKLSVRLKVQRFEASNFTLMTPQAQAAQAQAQASGVKTPPKPNFSRKVTPSAPMMMNESSVTFKAPCQPDPIVLAVANNKPTSLKENALPPMRQQQFETPLPPLPVIQCNPVPPLRQDLPAKPIASLPLLPVVQLRQSASSKSLLTEVETTLHRRSLADFTNYNTAPRGWASSGKEIYRPVTFKMA